MLSKLKITRSWQKIIIWTSIALLITLFVYAAYNKLSIYPTFVKQLKASPATRGFENVLAWLVPGIELAIATMLIIPRTRIIGLYSAFFLMLLFTAYVFVVPHFYQQQTCSCGGIINQFTWKQHFWFNIFFTLLAGTGLVLQSYAQKKAQIQ